MGEVFASKKRGEVSKVWQQQQQSPVLVPQRPEQQPTIVPTLSSAVEKERLEDKGKRIGPQSDLQQVSESQTSHSCSDLSHQGIDFSSFVANAKAESQENMTIFRAGNIKNSYNAWAELTSDPEILEMVTGYRLRFTEQPTQCTPPTQREFSPDENQAIDAEIKKLLEKGVLVQSSHEHDEFISTIFVRPKSDGSHRMILNLTKLNEYLEYHHFKMDSIYTITHMMTPGCYMAKLDIKDAYYSVPIHPDFQKYLKFRWHGTLFQFTCFPNGLSPCPRLFTKLLKPVFAFLRQKGRLSVSYIDDIYLQGQGSGIVPCQMNVWETYELLTKLGFVVHYDPQKSVFDPATRLEILGFTADSVSMTLTLTTEKQNKVISACKVLLTKRFPSIRLVAQVIGLLVSTFPAVSYGQLYYRQLENEKIAALKHCAGNFEASMSLSDLARHDLRWWIANIQCEKKYLVEPKVKMTIHTDASSFGYGYTNLDEGVSGGGKWLPGEMEWHINVKELKAIEFGLKALCKNVKDAHVKVMSDNQCAVSYIREQGGSHSSQCNAVARNIWLWAWQRNLWLTCAHIPGVSNDVADRASRHFRLETEWQLAPDVFLAIKHCFPQVAIDTDLFATRNNAQLDRYIAWKPDPHAFAIDALSISWTELQAYAFPPFSLIPRVLQKIISDKATLIVIVPRWPTQAWYPLLLHLLMDHPRVLPKRPRLLQLPEMPDTLHPLRQKMTLLACALSGNPLRRKDYQTMLSTQSANRGDLQPQNSTSLSSINGQNLQTLEGQINYLPL